MTTGWKYGAAVAFLVLVAAGSSAVADTVQLNPCKDNTLYEDPFGRLSNGQGQHFFVGRTREGIGLIRRGLIAFDIADNIPTGSTIESVVLTLHLSQAIGFETEIDLHGALQDWGEGASRALGQEGGGAPSEPGDATWLHTFFDSQFWTTQGGDFACAVSGSAVVSMFGFYAFDSMFNPGLVDDVQQWLDQPDTNFGWGLLVSDESIRASAKRFDTRENSNPDFRPVLAVTFTTH